jgi:hypothetical protein
MATTKTDLYRSVMGDTFKKIKDGVHPGDGVLDPRWADTQRFVKKTGKLVSRQGIPHSCRNRLLGRDPHRAGRPGQDQRGDGRLRSTLSARAAYADDRADVQGLPRQRGARGRGPAGRPGQGLNARLDPHHSTMPQIQTRTMLIAIEAIAARIRQIRAELA